jgi:hypothetical protein
MSKTINRLIATANAEVGYKETGNNITKFSAFFDKKHPDFYNTKKQGAAWCDIFVDYCFVSTFGEEQALDMLCQPKKSAGAGCKFSAQYYKKAGRFFDKPEVGDQIFFYVGGEINHTGIVVGVDDKKVYTVEGNSGNAVKAHSYNKDGNKKIAGYGRPRWKEEPSSMADTAPTKPTPSTSQKPQNPTKLSEEEIALQVINGMWGNGKERKQRLTEAGYDYDAIQKIVNKKIGSSSKPAPEKPKTFIGIVNTIKDSLRVRIVPNGTIIKLLPKGSKVELMNDPINGWYKLADGSGYVSAKYIIKA